MTHVIPCRLRHFINSSSSPRARLSRRGAALTYALLFVCVWCLFTGAGPALAQNVQFNKKAVDLGLRGATRVNPTTHAVEIEIPLASYPGRAGLDLPVTINYSSKVWRIAFSGYVPQTQWWG